MTLDWLGFTYGGGHELAITSNKLNSKSLLIHDPE